MGTPRTGLRLVVLQVRKDALPLRQEQGCFLERCRVVRRQVRFINEIIRTLRPSVEADRLLARFLDLYA